MIFRGLKARDMGRLAGNSPSHGPGFQPSIFMVMPLPMALPWAGMERAVGPEECQVIFRDSGSIPRQFKAEFRESEQASVRAGRIGSEPTPSRSVGACLSADRSRQREPDDDDPGTNRFDQHPTRQAPEIPLGDDRILVLESL